RGHHRVLVGSTLYSLGVDLPDRSKECLAGLLSRQCRAIDVGGRVRCPPPALSADSAIFVLDDETVGGELAQVVAGGAGVEAEPGGESRRCSRAVGAQQPEKLQSQGVREPAHRPGIEPDGVGRTAPARNVVRHSCKDNFAKEAVQALIRGGEWLPSAPERG